MVSQKAKEQFATIVESLEQKLDELCEAPRMKRDAHPGIPRKAGVYLFTERKKPVYVGQTRNLRQRLAQHTRPGGTRHNSTLAFLIAKKEAAKQMIDTKGSRAALESNQKFKALFESTKRRIGQMDVQFIMLEDPIIRTIFEVYVAVELSTKFNSFETY